MKIVTIPVDGNVMLLGCFALGHGELWLAAQGRDTWHFAI